MAAEIHTHIESMTKRQGSPVYRVVTGAGIYTLAARSRNVDLLKLPEYQQNIILTVAVIQGQSRIIGVRKP